MIYTPPPPPPTNNEISNNGILERVSEPVKLKIIRLILYQLSDVLNIRNPNLVRNTLECFGIFLQC